MLEGMSIATLLPLVVNVLGLPGLIFIVWYVDQKRLDKVMARNKEDMAKVIRMYEDNVILVQGYQKLAGELASIIHLNTQAQTNLVNEIRVHSRCLGNTGG